MNPKLIFLSLFLLLGLTLAFGFSDIKSKEDLLEIQTIDLDNQNIFEAGNYTITVQNLDTYLRVNVINKNNHENNIVSYHIPNSPDSANLTILTTEGEKKILSLENIPKPSTINPISSNKYNSYEGKIEEVLFDKEFISRKGYLTGDSIPVVISFDTSKIISTQNDKDSYTLSKEKLLSELSKGISASVATDLTQDLRIINGISLEISLEDLELIESLDFVKKITLDKKVQIVLEDSVPLMNASLLWEMEDSSGDTIKGDNITIAIIDTGVDYTHPDLGGCFGASCKVIGGYDFSNSDSDPMDDHGHGTHCAAIAASEGDLKGVAPNARIYAYKVLNSYGGGYMSDIIAGIERSMDPNQDGDISDHVDVISMSLGGPGDPDDEMSLAVDTAVDAGIVVVVAAGNSGPGMESIGSPGCARKALTVGASCKPSDVGVDSYCDTEIASFSSRGPTSIGTVKPDILAPGVNICAAKADGTSMGASCYDNFHTSASGTSMATPHIAGAAALMIQARSLDPLDLKSVFISSADDLGFELNEQGGGFIDLYQAYSTNISLSPSIISFGRIQGNDLSYNFIIKNLLEHNQSLTISVSDIEDEFGNSFDVVSLNETEINLASLESKSVKLIINLTEDIGGSLNGKIELGNNVLPFSLIRLSKLNIEVKGGKPLYPDIFVHDSNFSIIRSEQQGWSFEGDKTSFELNSGNYTVYAVGDFEDLNLEYLLMEEVEITPNSEINLTLNISDARPFLIEAESFSGEELHLYNWDKGFISYNNDTSLSYTYSDPNDGNRTVYISNRPSLSFDTDIFFKYHGVSKSE